MTEELRGTALAERAYELCQRIDPQRGGVHIADIEKELEKTGVLAAGDNPRSVLHSALNRQQSWFDRTGRGIWAWKPRRAGADEGISGKELEDAAHAMARSMDPQQTGFHYEELKVRLLGSGVVIKGPNQGQTLRRVLQASARFKMLVRGRGIWTWQ